MLNTRALSTDSTQPATRHLKLLLALPLVAAAITLAPQAHAQAYVNATVGGVFAPGVYGQIVIGNNPPPPVINARPVVVGRPTLGLQPIYLYAPPGHQRHWHRFCGRYNACGHPVYFVQVDPRNRWWEQHPHGGNHYGPPERRLDRGEHRPRPDGR
jgi:hypothetical protein